MPIDDIYDPAGTSTSWPIPTSTTGLTGSASDDSGSDHGGRTGTPSTTAGAAQVAASGDTPPEAPATPAAKSNKKLPKDFPERMSNPLSKFSSYTYQLSLYMLSPDAYNMFSNGDIGRHQVFADSVAGGLGVGARLIAQSGGANSELKTDTRAPGFDLDFYIDNLKMTSYVSGSATSTASNVVDVTFNIIEPYGFSFTTKLRTALQSLIKESSSTIPYYADVSNPLKQLFVLGIRFQGYDKNGKVMSGSDLFSEETMNVNATGVFERFLDLTILEMHYKLDGRATTYNIKSQCTPIAAAHGSKRGKVSNDARIRASNVAEALGSRVDTAGKSIPNKTGMKGLLDILNENQQILANTKDEKTGKPKIRFANKYRVCFIDDGDGISSPIGDASLISTLKREKTRSGPSGAVTTSESTESTARGGPNLGVYITTFKDGTPIMQAVSEIIKHSSYLEKSQKQVTRNDQESQSIGKQGGTDTGGTEPLRWYNLSTDVRVIGWDDLQGDWAYEITYVIQPYDTPSITTTYSNLPVPYYGPHKRYKYWYTGLNSEVMHFEQTLNTQWYNAVLAATGNNNAQGAGADVATIADVPNNGIKTGSLPGAMDAQNAYVTSLYDPGGWAQAKIKILGDPDYLTTNPPGGLNEYMQFYHPDMTINANGGSVFIELDFAEGVDYNNSRGTMDINSSIFVTEYPPEAGVQGICLRVITVKSTFAGGSFTQEVDCIMEYALFTGRNADAARAPATELGRGASSEGNAGEAEAQLNEDNRRAFSDPSRALDVVQTQTTTPTGGANSAVVADDDASAASGSAMLAGNDADRELSQTDRASGA